MLPTEVSIIRKQTLPSTNPSRLGKNDVLVVMQFDPFNTHSVIIPEEEFSEDRVRIEAQKYHADQQEWTGKKISLDENVVP